MKVALALMLVFVVAACVSGDQKCARGKAKDYGQPCICTFIYDPVCGTNGKIYANECEAGCDGVKKIQDHSCCMDPEIYK